MAEKRALTRNASDAQQVKRAGKAERLQRARDDEWLTAVLGTYEGRTVLWRLLGKARVFEQTHRGEETHETAFLNGERNIGLWLLAEITRVDLASYHQMQTEAQAREATIAEPAPKTDEPFEDATDGNDAH